MWVAVNPIAEVRRALLRVAVAVAVAVTVAVAVAHLARCAT